MKPAHGIVKTKQQTKRMMRKGLKKPSPPSILFAEELELANVNVASTVEVLGRFLLVHPDLESLVINIANTLSNLFEGPGFVRDDYINAIRNWKGGTE